eukprot:scaffold67585_cov35-Prasinocladus_malaysianus.AAC.1
MAPWFIQHSHAACDLPTWARSQLNLIQLLRPTMTRQACIYRHRQPNRFSIQLLCTYLINLPTTSNFEFIFAVL